MIICFTGNIEDGAVLCVADDSTDARFTLTSNSAILYLMSAAEGDMVNIDQWLHWEASQLQVLVITNSLSAYL